MSKDEDSKKNLPKLPSLTLPAFEALPISTIHVDEDEDDDDENVGDQDEINLDGDFEDAGDEPISDDDAKAFKLGLSCIYMPIHSQIDTTRKLSSCMDLVTSITRGFGYSRAKGSTYERYWKEFEEDCFPSLRGNYNEPVANRAKDIALEALRQRKFTIEKDGDSFYTKSSFSSEKEYNSWKSEALLMNNTATQSAEQARQKLFECSALVNVEDVKLENNKTLFGLSSSLDVLYKIRKGANDDTYLMESKAMTGEIDRKNEECACEVVFEEKPQFMPVDANTVVSIKFFYRYLKKTTRFAYVDIKVVDLIPKVEPVRGSWGTHAVTETFDILSTETNQKIGTSDITVDIQFQKFPKVAVQSNPATHDKTAYQELFNILVEKLIKSRRAESRDESALDFHQSWIIQEYASRYCISEVTKRLAIVNALCERPDLMCTFADYLRQSFDFLHGNNQYKFVHTTKQESKKFMNTVEFLTETLEKLLVDFKKYLKTKHKSLLDLIDLYQLLKNKYGDELDQEEFYEHVTDCIQRSITGQYHRIRGEENPSPKQLIVIAERLTRIVGDIKKYSDALPKYVKYESTSIETLYNTFADDFDSEKSSFSGKDLLVFCDKLKELNETVKINFKESETENVNFIEWDDLMDSAPRQYFKEMRNEHKKVVKSAITKDDWGPISESEPHSESVVALYNAAAADLSFLNSLHHIQREIMIPKFAEVVVTTAADYCNTLRNMCTKDLPINEQDTELRTVPEQFIIRLNDIYTARVHAVQWINNMEETPSLLSLPDEESVDCDLIEDLKKYDDVKLHKRNKTMAIKLETDDEDEKLADEKLQVIEMQETVDDLIMVVMDNYAPFIKTGMRTVMLNMKKEIGKKKNRSLPKDEFISAFGSKVENYFIGLVLEPYITPLITDFARITYEQLFVLLTRAIFNMMVQIMTSMIISEDDEPFKPLKTYQVIMLEVMYRTVYNYLDVKKPGGMRKSEMDKEARIVRMLFKLYDEPTPQVINLYSQFNKFQSLNRASRVKDRHIIALLATRKKDSHAKKFVNEHFRHNEDQRIVSTFNLKFPDTERDIVLSSFKCWDKTLKQNFAHMTKLAICVESKRGMFGKRRTGMTKSELKSTKSISNSQSSRVFLTDITAVRTSSSIVLGKGLKVYFGKDGVLRMYFKKTKQRDAFQNDIVKQGKKLGNKKVENDDKTKK